MNRKTVAVLVLHLLCTYSLILVLVSCPAKAIPSSNFISVAYQPQETDYYCGPACVQMALSYLSNSSPNQSQLASEMQTSQVTYIGNMRIPFDNRGFTSVHEEISMGVDELKTHNSNGDLVIILIYFSNAHQDQHYVLVVGYDSDGVYVHDPWPIEWQQPNGRTTGANASISNSLLADLWNCNPPYWGLVIPSLGAPPVQPTPWWIQYQYLLIAMSVLVIGVVVVIIVARRRKMRELPLEISPQTPSGL